MVVRSIQFMSYQRAMKDQLIMAMRFAYLSLEAKRSILSDHHR